MLLDKHAMKMTELGLTEMLIKAIHDESVRIVFLWVNNNLAEQLL